MNDDAMYEVRVHVTTI